MQEEIKIYIDDADEHMQKAIQHLESELTKIRAGKASPAMLAGIQINYYGTMTPINQVASINNQDARTLTIKPWEKSNLAEIEKAILTANLGVTPQNDGEQIRLNMPPLTEERRKDMVKTVKATGEQARVSVRNVRRDALHHIKELQKEGVEEDEVEAGEEKIQELTDKYIGQVDKHLEAKEKEILHV